MLASLLFELDFPHGSDMFGGMLYGLKTDERMEFELFDRLGANVGLSPAAD